VLTEAIRIGYERDAKAISEQASGRIESAVSSPADVHRNWPEELSELAAVRDQLKGILERLVQPPKESQLPPEFPTLGAFVHRINTLARKIATISKADPHRHELLNELTSLCFMAEIFCKREL
jgi:hypothetical protein